MEDKKVELSYAVAKILSDDNRDKSLGEASEEINEYVVTIKELVNSGEIKYETLQNEITKHIGDDDQTIPGSLAQLLVGCVGDNLSCPMKKNEAKDVPFAYDNKLEKIVPLSKIEQADNDNTYAILYFTGNPKNLNIKSLNYLENRGFKKLKIEYKTISSANYKTLYIENLSKYINNREDKDSHEILYVIGFLLLLLFFYWLTRN